MTPSLIQASCLLVAAAASASAAPSFQVANDAFLLNNEPIQIRSGSFHYHRCIPELWEDRMLRLQAMGLNAVQTYVPWNWHESAPGVFDFSGSRNVTQFFATAQKLGMLVLLRAGPYICGEEDGGGMPAYVYNVSGIELRTNNTQYLTLVDRWWNQLLPQVAPYIVSNGGPVAMVQIENEFGSYGSTSKNPGDKAYIEHLKDVVYSHLGGPAPAGIQLYTTDGGSVGYLINGALPGEVFATGDWGPDTNVPGYWAAEDQFNPPGMQAHTDSEYYTGWLTHWGEGMANTSTIGTVGGIAAIYAYNGSGCNLYMGYGGTNFGFWNGANGGGTSFQPVITSYDYDSPVSEGGIHGYGPDGDKYAALQQLFTYWADGNVPAEPPAPAVTAYGKITLESSASLWSNLDALSMGTLTNQHVPMIMEYYGLYQGYIVYRTTVPSGHDGKTTTLTISGLADRGEVFVNGVSVGVTYRPDAGAGTYTIPGNQVVGGAILDILIENMGHINYGHGFFDPKGITGGAVTFGGNTLVGNWTVVPMPFTTTTVAGLPFSPRGSTTTGANFYSGTLNIAGTPTDTYMTLCGWNKGTMWINGFHLGRYWETQGPQHSFYVPGPVLQQGANTVIVFEQHATNTDASINFVDVPDFTGKVCSAVSDSSSDSSRSSNDAQVLHTPRFMLKPPTSREDLEGKTAVPFVFPIADVSSSAAAAAPAPAAATCSTPYAGMNVTAQLCSSAATNTEWTWVPLAGGHSNAGVLQLASNSNLCVTPFGSNPTTGYPNLGLQACDATNSQRNQHFMTFPMLTSNPFMSLGAIPGAGMCIDVTGGTNAPLGTQIEIYDCNGGAGQHWSWGSSDSKQLVSGTNGWCLAAC